MKNINKVSLPDFDIFLRLILFICVFIGFISCNTKEAQSNAQVVVRMPEKNSGKLTLKYYVDSTAYVKLETDKETLIQSIGRVNIFDNKIYIHDSKLKSLFVFDMSGKFLFKIHKVGMGPEEYNSFTSFCIDRKKKLVLIHDLSKNSIYKYSAENGKFEGVVRIKEHKSFARDIMVLGNGDFLCYSNEYPGEAFCGIWELDNNGNFKKHLWKQTEVYPVIPTDPSPMLLKQVKGNLYSVYDVVNNVIYHYDGYNLKKAYQFDFSHLPIVTVSKYPGLTSMKRAELKLKDVIEVSSVQETSNYIWIKWVCNEFGTQTFYVKSENKMILPTKIDLVDGIMGRMVPTDNTDIVCFQIGAFECRKLVEDDKNNEIGAKVKGLMAKTNPDDNPIVQILYMKK